LAQVFLCLYRKHCHLPIIPYLYRRKGSNLIIENETNSF
jgi:hypothetical protein